jgi:hypothetical protein
VFGVVYRLQSCIILRTTYYGVRSTKRKERKSRPFAFAHLLKGVRGSLAGAQEHKTTDLKGVSTLCKRCCARAVPKPRNGRSHPERAELAGILAGTGYCLVYAGLKLVRDIPAVSASTGTVFTL